MVFGIFFDYMYMDLLAFLQIQAANNSHLDSVMAHISEVHNLGMSLSFKDFIISTTIMRLQICLCNEHLRFLFLRRSSSSDFQTK